MKQISYVFRLGLLLLAVCCLHACTQQPNVAQPSPDGYPEYILSNAHMTIHVWDPDPNTGFVRAARFDRSGIISQANFDHHTIFGPRKAAHDPLNQDDIYGTPDEFGIDAPLGYAQAKPGETFLKIGVGRLRRIDDKPYAFFTKYPLVEVFPWTVHATSTTLVFKQSGSDPKGFAYEYVKRLQLLPDRPGFAIINTLKNTGTNPLSIDHYMHNFILIDSQPIGPDYAVTFPWQPQPQPNAAGMSFLQIGTDSIKLIKDVPDGPSFWVPMTVNPKDANCVTVLNPARNVAITIQGDRELARFTLYGEHNAICPEAFVQIDLAPGQTTSWRTTYLFSTTRQTP